MDSSEVGSRRPSAGDALAAVFRERYASLVGLARLLLDERDQAEETVQEAFARTLEGFSRLREPADPFPYVRRAVINLSRSRLRRRIVARKHIEPVTEQQALETMVELDESRREIAEAVRALPRRQRECIVLRYFDDCSTETTAEVLGISEGSVKTHVHRAMATLSKNLEGSR